MIQKPKTYIPVQCASLITYIVFGGSLNLHLATFLYLVTMVAFTLVLSILIVLSGFRVFLVIKVRNLRSRLTKNSSMNLNSFYFNSISLFNYIHKFSFGSNWKVLGLSGSKPKSTKCKTGLLFNWIFIGSFTSFESRT